LQLASQLGPVSVSRTRTNFRTVKIDSSIGN